MKELEYPFDGEWILSKKKSIKKQLLQENGPFLQKKIAVLGGSTTSNICALLDLFLLNEGIQAKFYESEYAQYYADAMFDNPELVEFQPDLIFIHTSNVNVKRYPTIRDSAAEIEDKLTQTYQEF